MTPWLGSHLPCGAHSLSSSSPGPTHTGLAPRPLGELGRARARRGSLTKCLLPLAGRGGCCEAQRLLWCGVLGTLVLFSFGGHNGWVVPHNGLQWRHNEKGRCVLKRTPSSKGLPIMVL